MFLDDLHFLDATLKLCKYSQYITVEHYWSSLKNNRKKTF